MSEDEKVYHVTYARNLDGIAELGLVAGAGQSMGGGGNMGHSSGKIFLTEPGAVSFWFERAQLWAEHNSDDPLDDGLVPVVLRVTPDWDHCEEDEAGTADAPDTAWACTESIWDGDIEVWDGTEWVELGVDAQELAALSYDEDGDAYDDSENPLFPKLS